MSSRTELPAQGIENLSREFHRITGKTLPAQKIRDLLALRPLNAQRLSRFLQTTARIQLKKGQSEQVLRAIDETRGRKVRPPEIPARSDEVDPDLPGLVTPQASALAKALKEVFWEIYFDRVNRDLRLPEYGGDYNVRPFPLPGCPVDTQAMKVRLRDAVKQSRATDDARLARRIRHAFAFFMFGEALNRSVLDELFGSNAGNIVDAGLNASLFVGAAGQTLRMNGLSLLSRQLRNGDVIYVFADTPPHFESRMAPPRVYIGADSYELMDRVSSMTQLSGYCVEMGSGSGVQMIAAVKQHPSIVEAIGMERDHRAINVSRFNAVLNGAEDKVMIADGGDELSSLLRGRPASFAMTNPPFLALPEWIGIDPEYRPALSTGVKSRVTDGGFEVDLKDLFPQAGWGGSDGLRVTKQFAQTLFPVLSAGSQVVIYSQFAGDEREPTLFRDYIRETGGFSFAFEPVTPLSVAVMNPERTRTVEGQTRKTLSSSEAATTVARLIVSALMARQYPNRLRAAVKTGGPEHALMLMFAKKIEDSYRSQRITHFHDGFVVLTKDDSL